VILPTSDDDLDCTRVEVRPEERAIWARRAHPIFATRIESGDYVSIIDGNLCGGDGRVDFVDVPGQRALVDRGEGRKGGLAWIRLEWLRKSR